MRASVLLLLLPLAYGLPQAKRCKPGNTVHPSPRPQPQALVADGWGGHGWGGHATLTAEPEATDYPGDEGVDQEAPVEPEATDYEDAEQEAPVEPEATGYPKDENVGQEAPAEPEATDYPKDEDVEQEAPAEQESSYAPSVTVESAVPAAGGYGASSAYVPPVGTSAGGSYAPPAATGYSSAPTEVPVPPPSSPTGAPSSTAVPPAPASTATGTSGSPPVPATNGSCECGYVVSQYDNAYFPSAIVVDFGTVSDTSALSGLGLEVVDGWRVGSINEADGTYCEGAASNVQIVDGVLHLTVPGQQAAGGLVKGAELQTNEAVSGGIFTMNAQLDPGHGTCQAIFTYTENEDVGNDEQDIEILGQSMLTKSASGVDPGIQLTNWDPNGGGVNDFGIIPFTSDPTIAFHDYTIAWVPGGTKYYFDGTVLSGGPTQYQSVNPSRVIINNWSNGDKEFTQGPPVEDVVLKVKSLTYYYQTNPLASYPAYPAGCTEADACVV